MALLAAIFLVALMAAAAAAATEEIRYAVRRTANVEARSQAYWYALGAESLALARLAAAEGQQRTLLEQAAAEEQTLAFPIDGGRIVAALGDAQNCFNLNSLVRPGDGGFVEREGAAPEYERLLTLLEISPARARMLAASLTDWLDVDGQVRGGGAEDGDYAAASTPHRAGNTLLAEVEELRAVAGYDEEIFAVLRSHVCAWRDAEPASLNVGVLRADQAPVLAALFGPELTLGEAEEVIEARPAAGYADIAGFRTHPRIAEIMLDEAASQRLTLASNRFLLVADVAYLESGFRLESLIEAQEGATPRVVSRRFGSAE
jgi:general secretion pathway protein K